MKKILFIMAMLTATTSMCYSQNEYLQKWIQANNSSTKTTQQAKKVPTSEKESSLPTRDHAIGFGVGITSEGHLPITFHYVARNNVHYGFSVSVPLSSGTKGEKYSTINWDELSEDHVSEGSYYLPVTFDLGYKIEDFTIGIGLGLAFRTTYRNCFDEYHILGNNGSYYKEVSSGSAGEFKLFARYTFPNKSSLIRFFLSAQYTARTGVGATIGFEF